MISDEVEENKSWEYNDVVYSILSQQFFKKPHFITDRRSSKKLKIKGSNEIIEELIKKIRSSSKPFENNDEEAFIKELSSIFNIRAKGIFQEYKNRITNLEEVQKIDKKIKMMISISVVLSYFHKRTRDYTHRILKENFSFKSSILKKYSQLVKKEIKLKDFGRKKKKVTKKLQKLMNS
ncbi:MAG: hypothetical protein ACTSSF_13520 [Candidatus Heimdallarchaeaceae archaeon]